MRFDAPQDWVVEPGETSVKFYDRRPPDDNCHLEMSRLSHSQIDWSGLPLDQLLRISAAGGSGEDIRQDDMHRQSRPGVECVWVEKRFVDPQEGKPARSHIAIVRGTSAHALVTFGFWAAHAERLLPVWDEVMRSVDMGLKVEDQTIGDQRM